MDEIRISFEARHYQRALIDYFRKGGRRAFCTWHRKAGKDRVATFIESELAFKRPGLYWHALPKYEDARKVVWDAIMPDGKRLIDWAFPRPFCRHLNHEMKVVLPNGSIWQPVGADNFNSLVGAFPVHVTYSEFPIMNPRVRAFLRPAIAMADGTELIIGTPRGYNHAHDLWQYAKEHEATWYTSALTWRDTGVFTEETIGEERATMPEALFRQEYEVDWSAASVGTILGPYVEQAEKDGRIAEGVDYDPEGAPLEISSDIGRRHISAWWFWQPQVDGFRLVDYDEDSGLDAEEWIERLQERIGERKLARVWLPHDARAKTFAARFSPVEQFLRAFGDGKVAISPQTKKLHSINAAQVVFARCRFNRTKCKAGLAALRAWQYEYDDERKTFSRDPAQDWSTDAADAFCEGAKIMRERVVAPAVDPRARVLAVGELPEGFASATLNDMWREHDREAVRTRGRF